MKILIKNVIAKVYYLGNIKLIYDNGVLMLTFQCLHLPTNSHIETEVSHQVDVFFHVIYRHHLRQIKQKHWQ